MVRIRKKKHESISLQKTVLLVLVVLFFGIAGTIWYFAGYKVVSNDYMEVLVKVPHNKVLVGFNADPTLAFGKVPPGMKSWKEITVWNDETYPVRAVITMKGNMSPYVTPEFNDFVLEPEETKTFKFWASIPKDFPIPQNTTSEDHNYTSLTGKVRVRQYRI